MSTEYRHQSNPKRLTLGAKESSTVSIDNLQNWREAVREIKSWPEYVEQPTHSLDSMAKRLGIAKLFYKDESQRFGREIGSFKALGAPYAVYSLLADEVEKRTGTRPTSAQLRAGEFKSITERVTVCVSTDGNQGRGLAYGAMIFHCRCVVYIHGHVSAARKEAIERYGAICIRQDSEYEATFKRAKEDARMNDWHFVSSTSVDNFNEPLSQRVMGAYQVMVQEAIEQIPEVEKVTHVFTQGGVGSMPAAVFMSFVERLKDNPPRCIIVEPTEADGLYQSAVQGKPTPSKGSLKTLMAGLACRDVSPAAWSALEYLCSDYLTVPDYWAADAMKALAIGTGEADIPIVSGESASGGMGVMLMQAHDPELRERLGINEDSRVLLIGCEGATDEAIYADIVGETPDDVFARQSHAMKQVAV